MNKSFLSFAGAAFFCASVVTVPSFAQTTQPAQNLISNGNFEADANADGQPDGWGSAKGGLSWETEGANHFYRIKALEPGKMTLIYRLIAIPEGVRAVELSWKQRISELKPGKQPWYDARIMRDCKDAAGANMKGAPSAPDARKNN